tara:strand:- start:1844 stop:2959 length:1116 start_codon:yes stop_codon:yes gene_type:complete
MNTISNKIQFFDYPKLLEPFQNSFMKVLEKEIKNGKFVGGKNISLFESEFAHFVGAKYAIGVSSGTDGLLAILLSLNLPKGSDILVTTYTFIASAEAIKLAGHNPIFVDIDEKSLHPTIEDFKKAWTPNTKAIMYVHLFGETMSIKEIKNLCKEKEIFLVEDCAESFGSYYPEGGHSGTGSAAAAFSFFPAKTLGCLGDGGMVITDNKILYEKIKAIRNHGSFKRYYHTLEGGNMRLDSLQAGFLSILLNKATPLWLKKRKNIATYYLNNINNKLITLPNTDNFNGHSWYLFPLFTTKQQKLIKYLTKKNIETFIYWPLPLHNQPIYKKELVNKILPRSEKICKKILHIPISPHLKDNEIKYITQTLNKFK